MSKPSRLAASAVCLAACIAAGTPAGAHQTSYDNRFAVTMHVNPDDEPVAGTPSSIVVTRVTPPKGYRFSFATCGCRLRITTAAGAVLFDRPASKRSTFTFPSAAAYQLQYSGRARKGRATRSFRAVFAIRAAQS